MINKLRIFVIAFLLSPLLANAQSLDSKYIFEELEEVDSFRNWNSIGWQVLDTQSLLVDFVGSRSYLLILRHNVPGFRLTNEIEITANNNQEVISGIDRVMSRDQPTSNSVIEKIYLIPDRDARRLVRNRLIGTAL